MEGNQTSNYLFDQILLRRLLKNVNQEVHLRHFPHLISQFFDFLSLGCRGNITSHSPNPPLRLFSNALSAIEPKDRTFLLDTDYIGVEIFALSSVE